MCGIFGLVDFYPKDIDGQLFRDLCLLSESRGKEASGFARITENEIVTFKAPIPASEMVKGKAFKDGVLKPSRSSSKLFAAIGHSRLVTNGYEHDEKNNQPVIKYNHVVIHNGIIVNEQVLWQGLNPDSRISDLDSELIPEIINEHLSRGHELGYALSSLYSSIKGIVNLALIPAGFKSIILATNNGSIYYYNELPKSIFVFASERLIIENLLRKHRIKANLSNVKQLQKGELCSINYDAKSLNLLRIGEIIQNLSKHYPSLRVVKIKSTEKSFVPYENTSLEHKTRRVEKALTDHHYDQKTRIDELKRCTKCILPETFPFIEFDVNGVCNYCRNYQRQKIRGENELLIIADQNRKTINKPECLIPFSGGRDSSFVLHYVAKELKLRPIAYSYDWGMITDLARRNQSRMCGQLGIEHILISANIRKKRDNIRKNVLAWLRNPSLGTIPLFMAGDKQYFYYANELMRHNNLDLSILGENLLETTNFKSGFCGIKPNFGERHTYTLNLFDKVKLASYYGMQYLKNPAFMNSSLFDTLGAFGSYYIIKHNNLNLYEYIRWEEKKIVETLINEYDWEIDPGTKTTWRIGDGTAAFYNYIYYIVAGFTENDTFRSNQIREGILTRPEAMEKVENENMPRWDSLQWYCTTIGIEFLNAIKSINQIETLY